VRERWRYLAAAPAMLGERAVEGSRVGVSAACGQVWYKGFCMFGPEERFKRLMGRCGRDAWVYGS